uniref:Neurotransmitter-gated ion-channel transmembrane domain-containing protein n=1 Tax=Panagrolaimus sp. ES5 TaxID=591445 RepID=A0AC34F776_9BILA
IYLPTYTLIVLSWVAFWMDTRALTFQYGNIVRSLPRTSVVKAVDIWMFSCVALLELAIVAYNDKLEDQKQRTRKMSTIGNMLIRASLPGMDKGLKDSRRGAVFGEQGTRDLCRKLAASDLDIPDPDMAQIFDEGKMPTMIPSTSFQKIRKRKPASELGAKIDRIASITFPMVCFLPYFSKQYFYL